MKNWKTTITSIVSALWIVLRVVNPDFFTEEVGLVVTSTIDVIIGLVMSWIGIFSAKDENKIANV